MLSKEETAQRLELFMGQMVQELDLPLPLQVMARQFLPFVPGMLQDETQRQRLEGLLANIAWVMGYDLILEPEDAGEGVDIAGQTE